ncbi:MAG: outer membrane beta-barrel protein [Burkholderiaceae bacterium]
MKKVVSLIAIACAAAFSGNAMAQDKAAPAMAVKPFLGFGLTLGGDKLATAVYDNGTEADIRAGNLVQMTAGVEIPLGTLFSASASVSYHVDNASAENGSLKFDRFPVEVLAHYKLNDQWRIGAGARFVSGATLGGSGVASMPDVEFDSTTGAVLQAEYQFNANTSLIVRGVSEKYKVNGFGNVDGSHFGVLVNYKFN